MTDTCERSAIELACPFCGVIVEAFPWGDDAYRLSAHRVHSDYYKRGLVSLDRCSWCHGSYRLAKAEAV